jgi:ABC-type spermidine/putrescine transport system permease subunit II
MEAALSRNGRRLLQALFVLVVVFLYAPIVILFVFSFNDSALPSFPLSGFTLHWYHQFIDNADLRASLETSAIIASLTSLGAVFLGTLASIALARRRQRCVRHCTTISWPTFASRLRVSTSRASAAFRPPTSTPPAVTPFAITSSRVWS